MMAGRIRVVVAGDIYPSPSLVQPFLEDDGYDVVGQARTRHDLLPVVIRTIPDAVVIDERLLSGRGSGRLVEKIRRVVPDAKLVVLTSAPSADRRSIAGVDATLEKGLSLSALSALLARLFGEDVPEGTLVTARVAAEPLPAPPGPGSTAGATRFVATVALPLLLVWILIAVFTRGGGVELGVPDPTDLGGSLIVVPQGTDRLDDAYASLDRMLDAIESGNYVLAQIHATALMDARATAASVGYSTAALDADVTQAVRALSTGLPQGVLVELRGILGSLFPVLEDERTPGGGSDVIVGPDVASSTDDGGAVVADGSSDDEGGANGGGSGDGGSGTGGDGGGTGDGGTLALGPGDGRAWGLWHKANKAAGGPPPWANGNAAPPHRNADQPHGRSEEPHAHRGDPPGRRAGDGNSRT